MILVGDKIEPFPIRRNGQRPKGARAATRAISDGTGTNEGTKVPHFKTVGPLRAAESYNVLVGDEPNFFRINQLVMNKRSNNNDKVTHRKRDELRVKSDIVAMHSPVDTFQTLQNKKNIW